MRILKFGGSSLATPERIRQVGRIVFRTADEEQIVVVVSAFQGITNQLLACARLAGNPEREWQAAWRKIVDRHRSAIRALVSKKRVAALRSTTESLLHDLHDALHGVQLLSHAPPRALDLVASFGERLSAQIVAAYLNEFRPAQSVDARDLIVTDAQFTNANVDFNETNRRTSRATCRFVSATSREKSNPGHHRIHRFDLRRANDNARPRRIGLHSRDHWLRSTHQPLKFGQMWTVF